MLLLALPGRVGPALAEIVGAEPEAVIPVLRKHVIQTLNALSEAERQAAEAEHAAVEAQLAEIAEPEPPAPPDTPPAPIPGLKRRHVATGRPRGRPVGSVSIRSF